MAIKRPSKKVLQGMLNRRSSLTALIHQHQEIAQGANSDFWKAIKKRVLQKRADIDSRLDDYDKLTHDQIVATLESRRELKFFSQLPENALSLTEIYQRELEDLEVRINDYRNRLKSND